MKIHKTRRKPLFSPAAAVILFLAVCAYSGAWFLRHAEGNYELAELHSLSFADSCHLSGIALRREQQLCSRPSGKALPASGQRVRAGYEISDISAASSAVFYDNSDGFEYLSPDALRDLSPSALKALMAAKPEKSIFSQGRLIYGHDWYYAASADARLTFDCPKEYLLRFDGIDRSVPAELIYKSSEEEGRLALIFRLTANGEEFSALRLCEAELIFEEYSGLQIPSAALHRDKEGNNFVYTLTAGEKKASEVEIIYKNGELCIAAPTADFESVREGSLVIVSGKKSDEGSLKNDYS